MANNHSEIEKRLWASADELRANSKLKSSEYSVPVLGLIFLRYADHKFAIAEKELAGKGTGRRAIGKEDYQAKGVMYLPPQARFSKLLDLPEGENIGKAINEAMKAVEAENEELKGVLPKNYNKIENSTLVSLLKNFSQIPVDAEGDTFGKIYEYFLGNFARAEGQKGGEFFTPTSLVKLIVEIIEPYHGRIFDPASGSGGMFVQSADFIKAHKNNPSVEISVYGQERVDETRHLCLMNLAVHALSGDIRQGNSYYEDLHEQRGQVRLRDGKSAVQRGQGGQGEDQGRSPLPVRDAQGRQRQLPVDSTLLQFAECQRVGPDSSWRIPPPMPGSRRWRFARSCSRPMPSM